jgi:hypothetical protein
MLEAYWHDFIMTTHALAMDMCPEVRICACTILAELAHAVPEVSLSDVRPSYLV